MSDRQVYMKFGGNAAASVDAYLEYKRIVGEDDGGVMFTPDQYEAYKKKVLPMRLENRIFTAWSSPTGMDCKLIGPETQCFCQHKYVQHKTDFEKIPSERPILVPCKIKGCGCKSYHYVPKNGTQPIRCSCKHFADEHSAVRPHKCKNAGCKCSGFLSSYTCGCGQPYDAHTMITETKEERVARGHPVGQDVPYQAMGGLTGFSSLMEGYMRLDPSGIGAPPDEYLNQPITSSDHPFLRANVESIRQYKLNQKAIAGRQGQAGPSQEEIDADLAERMSAMRRPGESEMDYYERRYQERQKAERLKARGARALPATKMAVGKRAVAPKK
ncbi:protein FAM221A-like [Dreissena polymorpha]|uniref:Protein FAM221A n=1 Tax=Dreissena polymorpha TaxID=45954 RepID=A0A9D4BDP8_DREPO|nr:protein FAM221A-like [Dreissena polymorpha]KAH3691411.1 hypothetical protein DPMN_194045 [Dreissena polymorpha]